MKRKKDLFVVKRTGERTLFDKFKIEQAILKAMKYGSGIVNREKALQVANDIQKIALKHDKDLSIKEIETFVYLLLIQYDEILTAKSYEGYRAIQAYKREKNTTDESILSLIDLNNEDVMRENSNKNPVISSTQRDLIAGEVSKDIARRKMIPARIMQAHDECVLHMHDTDYYFQKIFNCCLVNLGDMLDNGTVINKRMIESPNSFQVACTVTTQIIAQIASNQYGGQSIDIKHLGKYLRRSKVRFFKMLKDVIHDTHALQETVDTLVQKELESGIQTIQYQVNTIMCTNGQSPFLTIFLHLRKDDPYIEENARIIEEILKQRIQGIKNEKGVYTTPAFPKLIYVLDDHNCLEGGQYDYLTRLAAKCSAKRMYPDYISAKEMRKNYEGNVFSCMGCRSFLSPWKDENGAFKFEGRFNMGVVSLNLPQIGIIAAKNKTLFWELLERRLELCKEALLLRYEKLKGVVSDVSPIHWQHGAIARLKKGETIDKLLENGYATISLGYIGLYELTKLMIGESHTTEKGEAFALQVMRKMRETTDKWKQETGLGFGLYGTPAESLCHRFAKYDLEHFGSIKDITDKEYYTNSYHIDVREEIDAFSKIKFESQFQLLSSGGSISYCEVPSMVHNIEAIEEIIKYIYHNIQYGELNTKSDFCSVCHFDGEMRIKDDAWHCPNCGNTEQDLMTVIRRTCGYLGENYWTKGKTNEIAHRVLHI